MKDDLIWRQATMDAICKDWCNERRSNCIYPFDKNKDDYYYCDGCDDVEIIKNMPSAQPEPKTGEWIKATGMMPPEFHGHHCCSECGSFANMCPPFGNREDLSDFCPNCGAKMKGADDDSKRD